MLQPLFKLLRHLYRYGVIETARRIVAGPTYRASGMGAVYAWRYGWHKGICLLRRISGAECVYVALDHYLGGGATSYLDGQIGKLPRTAVVLVVRPTPDCAGRLMVQIRRGGSTEAEAWFFVGGLRTLARLVRFSSLKGAAKKIVINELVRWEYYERGAKATNAQMDRLVDSLIEMKRDLSAEMLYLCHDYYSVCPRFTLMTDGWEYCASEVSREKCRECLARCENTAFNYELGISIDGWRASHARLFAACDEVRTFSEDTRRRISACYPETTPTLVPHECIAKFDRKPKLSERGITIGVIGGIHRAKGSRQVEALAKYLWEIGRGDVKIKVVGRLGEIEDAELPNNLTVYGRYQPSELSEIIEREGINVAFFSSVWPETFSYVTQELMMLDLPIVCYPIGAPQDRVASYAKGAVALDFTSAAVWNAIRELMHEA